MKKWSLYFILTLISLDIFSQNCSILSKANNITPDKLCSPVTAAWNVTYTGVNDAGTPVQIMYDWDDGASITVPATQAGTGIFQATAVHTYTSSGNICNYHPQATLIVNGVLCTSSVQEQIVTVWDDDNHNGGEMHINPVVYPICLGDRADARFQDLTQFNCVPPQERDNPNVNTRWIQWIYGTDITMTGTPVTINGTARIFPYSANIITLTGPVTGSGVWSDFINVASDKLLNQHFQVTLRNWNYCNPYDDPAIPGTPADPVNGDHPPVLTTAIILIVPYPDATITPVGTLCTNNPPVILSAHDTGGTWSGNGVSGNEFNPAVAGPGNHIVRYNITNANGCSDSDDILITVVPIPDATITEVGVVCSTDTTITLSAHDPGGTWAGTGITGNVFDPSVSGPGNHTITYTISDSNGCTATDQMTIIVATPDATINPIDTLCIDSAPVTLTAHDLGGVWTGMGVSGNTFNPSLAGAGNHIIRYTIFNADCPDFDTATVTVIPVPDIYINNVGTLYLSSQAVNLIAAPSGGIFTGTGVSGTLFNPSEAGLGTHVIQYATIPDRFGCMSLDTIHITVIQPPPTVADFGPDTVGCSPLVIRFVNRSSFGESYLWDFDDGQYSNEENPVHTFFVPGNYLVSLTANNVAGVSTHSEVITVHQNPSAIFNAYPTEVVNNEQVVVFHNYSYYNSQNIWNFGDGGTSGEENPYHKYENPGRYTVTLTVITEDGCIDSAILDTPVVVDWKTGQMKFPNVFRWNGTGPTGGQWREGVYPEMDFVFRPFFENVIHYKLQIFNRWGVLIYESDDVYRGWDGYFGEGSLAAQGVYVWKVTGQYVDGKYFNIVGDVTFLH